MTEPAAEARQFSPDERLDHALKTLEMCVAARGYIESTPSKARKFRPGLLFECNRAFDHAEDEFAKRFPASFRDSKSKVIDSAIDIYMAECFQPVIDSWFRLLEEVQRG